ncbi:hypothetical protein DYB32_003916 [Aphanomyces invadans]|uniref:Uncharacterized protein n=1 Tax=Aphanomyces invadans TaxID=157072 RepID=A0A3R6Z5N0_9STRA|nr:hypothetical protein DYB32_003916 [Aphanomyces invadans]
MLSLPDAAAILVKCGGFRLVLHLLRTVATRKDTKLKQLAALLLKRLAAPERNKDVVADEPEIAKMLCQLVQDPYLDTDVAFRRDLLEALVLLAQDRRAARHFVEFNIVPSLLLLLASPPHLFTTSFLVLSLLELFASNPHNLSSLLHDDIIPSVLAAAFHDRPPQAPMSLSTPTASSGMDLTAVRVKALMVFNHLIASEKLHLSTEKRIKRLTVTLLTALACHLRHDAAALQIQGIMRNWLVRKATQAMRLDAFPGWTSPRKKRLQHIAIRAGKVLVPKQDATTEAIQSRFLGA